MNQDLKMNLQIIIFFSVPLILHYFVLKGILFTFVLWLYIFFTYIYYLDRTAKNNTFLDNLIKMDKVEFLELLDQARNSPAETWSEKDKIETKRDFLFTAVLGTNPFYKKD